MPLGRPEGLQVDHLVGPASWLSTGARQLTASLRSHLRHLAELRLQGASTRSWRGSRLLNARCCRMGAKQQQNFTSNSGLGLNFTGTLSLSPSPSRLVFQPLLESGAMAQPGPSCSSAGQNNEVKLEDLFGRETTDDLPAQVWLKELRDKIYDMFRMPLMEDYGDEVFKWISALCMCKRRFTWLCSSDHHEWSQEETKIFSCISRMSINELHILLPHLSQHLTCGDQVEIEEGKVMSRPANECEYDKFGVHLLILEETIQSLVHGQDDDEPKQNSPSSKMLTHLIEPKELKSLLERLKEVVSELIDHLELVHRYWPRLIENLDSRQFQAAQGVLRVVSVWLAEDIGSFQPQCKRFLIDLMTKNLLLCPQLSDTTNLDLIVMSLHSICLGEHEMDASLKQAPSFRAALQKYIDYAQQERQKDEASKKKRTVKEFKLRCALVKDLIK